MSSSNRRDYLADCNEHGVPVEDFRQAFCARCCQPECGRSQYGTAKFDQRTGTWEERLFLDVPRMKKDDPRYLPIIGADFRTVDLTRTSVAFPAAPQWNDPRDLPRDPAPLAKTEISAKIPERSSLPDPEQAAPLPVGVRNLPSNLLLMNTPAQPTMLPGAPAPQGLVDPWAGPLPKEEGVPLAPAPVVKKGARIKFGGGE